MAAATYKNNININTCMDVIDPTKLPPSSPLTYFLSITVPQPKIRIKIPKMLVKTIKRRLSSKEDGDDDERNFKKGVTPRKLFSKKVGRIFSNVFGHKKRKQERCYSKVENWEVYGSKNALDLTDKDEDKMLKKVRMDEMGHVKAGDKQSRYVSRVTLDCEDEEEEGSRKRTQQLSFKSLFNKRNGVAVTLFRGNKLTKANTVPGVNTSGKGVTVGTGAAIVIGRQKSSQGFPRVPSRILTTRQRLKMARSIAKKAIKMGPGEFEHGDGERSVKKVHELCKKRILMGEKCRPLNHSGTLQYDEDGVLLPEILP